MKNDNLDRDIKETAQILRDQAEDNWQAISKAYWDAHKAVAETSFSGRWEQMQAVRKLSQLGLALSAATDALSAINTARCN